MDFINCRAFPNGREMMYVPVRQSIMADMVPNEARGSYMAINGMVFQVAK